MMICWEIFLDNLDDRRPTLLSCCDSVCDGWMTHESFQKDSLERILPEGFVSVNPSVRIQCKHSNPVERI